MVLRKRRQPTPWFRQPPSYDPIAGKRAPLDHPGVTPYCALMQVAAEDTHQNYLICRGYDTRERKFFDYVEGDPDKEGIAVAKPYGRQTKGIYQIGQVIPAMVALTGLYSDLQETWVQQGQNPGVSTAGHPKVVSLSPLLTDPVSILYDDNGKAITWMAMHGECIARIEMTDALSRGGAESAEAMLFSWNHAEDEWNEEPIITVYNTQHLAFSKPATAEGDRGADGWVIWCVDRNRWELLWLEIPGFFFATLDGTLSHGDASTTVTVTDVISGYNLWNANYGTSETVWNPVAFSGGGGAITHWFAGYDGDACLCRWDERDAKFWIFAIEPNDAEWQDLDVVVDVDFVTPAFTTKGIRLPPWTPVPA